MWNKFSNALKNKDKNKIASMCKFPLHIHLGYDEKGDEKYIEVDKNTFLDESKEYNWKYFFNDVALKQLLKIKEISGSLVWEGDIEFCLDITLENNAIVLYRFTALGFNEPYFEGIFPEDGCF